MGIISKNLIYKKSKHSNQKIPQQKWMTSELLIERQSVLRLKKLFHQTRLKSDWDNYHNADKIYKGNLETTYDSYFEKKLNDAGNNGKLIWRCINEGLQRKSKNLELPDKIICDDKCERD